MFIIANNVFNLTFFFQLLNTVIWIGIIYIIFNLAVKLPKRLKQSEDKIEKVLEKINKKLD